MKTLVHINWFIIAIYCIYGVIMYLDTLRSGMDPAGRGMAMGFLFVGMIYVAFLIILNIIPVKWVRVLAFALGLIPMLIIALEAIRNWRLEAKYKQQARENSRFEDPHLNDMLKAIQASDPEEMRALLEKDNSRIDYIGATNQRTILDIALHYAFSLDQEEADAIVLLLLEHGGDPNVFHSNYYAPLANYGLYIDTLLFRALLEAGADPNVKGEQSIPLVYTLIERGRDDLYEKVDLLIAYGLDPNLPLGTDQPYQLNYSLLVWAAHYEQWAVCRLLLQHGADADFQPAGPDGRTFQFILEEKEEAYRESGNIPADYAALLEYVRDQLKS